MAYVDFIVHNGEGKKNKHFTNAPCFAVLTNVAVRREWDSSAKYLTPQSITFLPYKAERYGADADDVDSYYSWLSATFPQIKMDVRRGGRRSCWVDCTKLSGSRIFFLLMLMRQPQEYPAGTCNFLRMIEGGVPWQTAIILAQFYSGTTTEFVYGPRQAIGHPNPNHCLLRSSFTDKGMYNLLHHDILEEGVWKDEDKRPYAESLVMKNLNNFMSQHEEGEELGSYLPSAVTGSKKLVELGAKITRSINGVYG